MGMRWSSSTGPKSQEVLPEKLGQEGEESFIEFQHRLQAFIKGGECSATYTAFQDCVEEAEKNKENPIPKCFFMLEQCMEDHPDYYHPYLSAKKAAMRLLMKDLMPQQLKDVQEEDERYSAFMRASSCKEPFNAWVDCADEAKEDYPKKCVGVFSMLYKCMEAHPDHVQPSLAAKQSAEDQFIKDLQSFLSSQPR